MFFYDIIDSSHVNITDLEIGLGRDHGNIGHPAVVIDGADPLSVIICNNQLIHLGQNILLFVKFIYRNKFIVPFGICFQPVNLVFIRVIFKARI